jgi:hypothetical protein
MHKIRCLSAIGLVIAVAGCDDKGSYSPVTEEATGVAVAALRTEIPSAKTTLFKGRVRHVFGTTLSTGSTAEESSESLRKRYASAFGVNSEELVKVVGSPTTKSSTDSGLDLMLDKATGKYKYKLYRYQQMADGLPVHRGELRTLVRTSNSNPVVWAYSTTKQLSKNSFVRKLKPREPDLGNALSAVLREWPSTGRGDLPPASISIRGIVEQTIFTGNDENLSEPIVASRFEVVSNSPQSSWTIIADTDTGKVLSIENNDHLEDLIGTVRGLVTPGARAMDCDDEVSTVMPYAEVSNASLGTFQADKDGHYVIANPGTTSLDIVSTVGGKYFDVLNYSGSNESLTQVAVPPGPVDFLHNPSNASDALRAQSNAYVMANQVRDFLLSYLPNYPTISTQKDFPIYVNRTDGYCPGNAWYSSSLKTLNFCAGSSAYSNTAFGSVVHHEFGHHIVNSGGSGQGAYGEGMSDTIGMLLSDDPGLGYGFNLNACNKPLRNADNDCQYSATSCSSCGYASHDCGQLLSGIIWDIRNALLATEPQSYRETLATLVLNSIPLHVGTVINDSIAIDLLTLDDNDGNLDNGTPHYAQICAGFTAHGIRCPAIATGLDVAQPADTSIEGPLGGPFTPESMAYTLTNLGPDTTINYVVQAATPTPWLSLSNSSGAVALGSKINVNVAVDQAVAAALPKGTYNATLNFTNTTNGIGSKSYAITLQVGVPVSVFHEDFSSGLGGFTLDSSSTNYWHRSTSCVDSASGHTSPGSLYFGSDSSCNFALGNVSGSVTSPEITIFDPTNAELTFKYYIETEKSTYYDKAQVLLSSNGGDYAIIASNNSGGVALADGAGVWREAKVNLSESLVGASSPKIRIRFSFNSLSSSNNNYTGFFVDDVKIAEQSNTCLTNSECDDGLVCNGVEQCLAGTCTAGTAVICDDGISCTVDTCSDTQGGCVSAPNDAVCSDGMACNGVEICSLTSGCMPGTVLNCNDGNACTTDSCDNSLGCQHTNVSCDDGNACTTDSCNATAGCTHGALYCNDNNECTTDSCNVSTGCVYTAKSNGVICTDDGNSCTSDVCSAGTCIHSSNGSCSLNPCASYCSSPVKFSGNFQSGNLGTGVTCYETTGNINGGNCGNFVTGRTLYVNGTALSCNNGNWPSLPAKVNGGYCVYTTAGNHPWAYFTTW